MSDEPFAAFPQAFLPAETGPPSGPPLLPCPECGKEYKGANGLGVHRSTMHGVLGPSSSKPKKKKRQRSVALTRALPAVIEEDDRWSTEEIFVSVVSLLWPKGTMPIAALPILIEWRDSTDRMLRRLEEL